MSFLEITYLLAIWNIVTTFGAAILSELNQPHNEQDRLRAASRHARKRKPRYKQIFFTRFLLWSQFCPWKVWASASDFPLNSFKKMDVTTSDLGDDFVLIHSHHENRQGFLQGVRKDPVQDPSPHFSRLGGTLDYSDIDSKEYVILHDDSDRQENVDGAPAQPRPLLLPTLSSRTLGVLYRFTGRCSVPPLRLRPPFRRRAP
ncbi:hypothetical protein BCR43DRAFT_506713 [Syncephalastrum racemosum]|uniref:Uncharacterized protein n=1 Tax=Syncephalastrum racemosum TaxID=13706 RepID=A0A1X2H893_SYNRA|nr:hypothetical protein BCR43DRAFT_506713 [Syncephalastrum racemosum]